MFFKAAADSLLCFFFLIWGQQGAAGPTPGTLVVRAAEMTLWSAVMSFEEYRNVGPLEAYFAHIPDSPTWTNSVHGKQLVDSILEEHFEWLRTRVYGGAGGDKLIAGLYVPGDGFFISSYAGKGPSLRFIRDHRGYVNAWRTATADRSPLRIHVEDSFEFFYEFIRRRGQLVAGDRYPRGSYITAYGTTAIRASEGQGLVPPCQTSVNPSCEKVAESLGLKTLNQYFAELATGEDHHSSDEYGSDPVENNVSRAV